MIAALILVDIQNDYFPGGAYELDGAEEAAAQASKLLSSFRKRSLPVIHIQHVSTRPGATFFLPDTIGAEIHPSVRPRPDEPVFRKHYPNGFRDTSLLGYLQIAEVNQLVFAGMMTHLCIDTTVRAAADLGFKCFLAHDACATRDLSFDGVLVSAREVQAAYMSALNGMFAEVLRVDDVCKDVLHMSLEADSKQNEVV